MSVSLRKERDLLEARVKERTSQLEETNEQLQIQMAEIERLQENLRKQALRDPLTGLYNRRYLSEAIEREISTAKREEKDLSVIAIDLDHFKDVNDTFGHQVGDQYLIIFAALLRSRIRKSDIACRYGGEEFLLVLPGISLEDAVKRSEEIRREYANTTLPGRGINKKVTISIGIATYPLHGKESEDIIVKADKALYMSKENGRNRVTVWEEKG
jgi:diguanylate cyclase (GGDEF)-like protein